ncbi:MAG TPA: hypothetical protein VL049_29680 [Candidatus Dormibacteraeota bacterium]|nr:hypothetical protein [Candidatus Dormibacteraeota bacterium]
MTAGTRVFRIAVALLALLAAQPTWAVTSGVDWNAVLRALGGALNSWRQSPFDQRTPTSRPPTRTITPQRTFTPTRVGTATKSPTVTATETLTKAPTRTKTPTRTATETRVPTSTRPPTATWTPRPTSTPVPTLSSDGQLALASAEGLPPAQKLASAFVIFPYIVTSTTQDTRVELMNMSDQPIDLQCFYVRQSDCVEVGFFVSLTANQPLSWLANDGASNPLTFSAVPPFDGVGELKCAVASNRPELSAHNVLQGRVLIYDNVSGETVGYDAIGFQKLSPGGFTGVINLDGFTYESCPDRLHFIVLTSQGGATSSLITVPCAEDLFTQTPTETVVQMAIINEFEQVFSSSYRQTCLGKPSDQTFARFGTLSKATLGTDTAHLVVRGVSSPLVGLVIDRFLGQNSTLHTTANEPFLEGGRESTVVFP